MPTPTGSEFLATYMKAGLPAWEAAAIAIARDDGLTPFPWVDLALADERGNTATLRVMTDVLAIGPLSDFLRLPTLPATAQAMCNLHGWLLPTPWLVYQMYRQAPARIEPHAMNPNLGASLTQYAAHSSAINEALAHAGLASAGDPKLRAGLKKHIVVSNISQPGKVLIFGWYHPLPDAWPSNGVPFPDPRRQPIQPLSNAHGDFYVDYSHGIQPVGAECIVNGQKIATLDLYQHPLLSGLVSKEGPVRVPRYPAPIAPRTPAGTAVGPGVTIVPTIPSLSNQGLDAVEVAKLG